MGRKMQFVYNSWMQEGFSCPTIKKGIVGSSLFRCLYHNQFFHCSVPCNIYRRWSTGLSESYDTQASAKSCSSLLISLMNLSFSSSVIPLTLEAMLVMDWRSLSSMSATERSSTTELKALLMQGQFFFKGQFQARCPCWEHSKHLPSWQCFCFSTSIVAFHAVLMSMASGSVRATLGLAGQLAPCCPCPRLFQGNVHKGEGLFSQAAVGGLPPFLLKACVRIQFRWFL
jgi:hypothetical protein